MLGLYEIDLKADSGRYFWGMRIFSWSKSASNRFGLAERVAPALQRLADQTNDTAYFMLRVDDDALCLDRREGNFPIKTISVRVGNRWPLGVGAGGEGSKADRKHYACGRHVAGNAASTRRNGKIAVR